MLRTAAVRCQFTVSVDSKLASSCPSTPNAFTAIRELEGDNEQSGFTLAPALPGSLFEEGKTYGITNLKSGGARFEIDYTVGAAGKLETTLTCHLPQAATVTVTDEDGKVVATAAGDSWHRTFTVRLQSGAIYRVMW